MYDLDGTDTDREWVEIQNSGAESVTITTGSGSGSWRFVDNSPHTLTLFSGDATLAPGQFAIIAKNSTQFLVDNPSFSGTLFTSAISLPNTTATLSIKNGEGTVLDTYAYNSETGAKDDGNSLQKIGSTFVPAVPTPGNINSSSSVVVEENNEETDTQTNNETTEPASSSSSSTSAHSSPAPVSETVSKIDFEVHAGRNRLTSVGNTLVFKGELLKSTGITEHSLSYTWSFGDGSVAYGKTVEHSYRFPGEYNVILNTSSGEKQAVSRLVVKVIQPEVSVKKVPGGIELHNKTKQEINLNGWNISSNFRIFRFPVDTLIGPDKKIVFPDNVTGMSVGDVSLRNPYGDEFSAFKEVIQPIVITYTEEEMSELEKEAMKLQSKIQAFAEVPVEAPIIIAPTTLRVVEKSEAREGISNIVVEEEEAEKESMQVVFEAEKKQGFVNKMLALPIKGLDFIFSIFE